MPWLRASLVWMLIMLAETGHGMVREVFIAPVIGGLRARQLGVLVGCIRSEEHTSELQSRELISHAVFCLDRKSVV